MDTPSERLERLFKEFADSLPWKWRMLWHLMSLLLTFTIYFAGFVVFALIVGLVFAPITLIALGDYFGNDTLKSTGLVALSMVWVLSFVLRFKIFNNQTH